MEAREPAPTLASNAASALELLLVSIDASLDLVKEAEERLALARRELEGTQREGPEIRKLIRELDDLGGPEWPDVFKELADFLVGFSYRVEQAGLAAARKQAGEPSSE